MGPRQEAVQRSHELAEHWSSESGIHASYEWKPAIVNGRGGVIEAVLWTYWGIDAGGETLMGACDPKSGVYSRSILARLKQIAKGKS